MRWLVLIASVLSVSPVQNPAPAALRGDVDASALKIGAPTTIVDLDLGRLKGELREVAWSPDGAKLYLQTVDGNPPAEKRRHYWVAVEGGAVLGIDTAPDWADQYWAVKSDRFAPGLPSVVIDVVQSLQNVKFGTGSAGLIDSADRAGNISIGAQNVDRANQQQKQAVVRLMVFGEAVSEFVNQRAVPGLMFSWGPSATGTIAYTTLDGDLILLDRQQRKHTVGGVHEASLPAWSLDGTRLAWVQKAGRKKYTLYWATVAP